MGWHLVITEEMRAMGLSGNDLMVYALIYGFSQKGQGCFYGGLSYICSACGISKRTAIYILQGLVSKGLISRSEFVNNGVKYVTYKTTEISANSAQVVQEMHLGSAKSAPNNIDNNINKTMCKEQGFNFKSALLEIGVSEAAANEWLQVRKTKKATNTEIAFNKIRMEITKSGMSPDNAIRLAVENSWSGFKAEWVINQRTERRNVPPKKKESVFEHNLKVMDQMFGSDLHSQAYQKPHDYDEQ